MPGTCCIACLFKKRVIFKIAGKYRICQPYEQVQLERLRRKLLGKIFASVPLSQIFVGDLRAKVSLLETARVS